MKNFEEVINLFNTRMHTQLIHSDELYYKTKVA